MKSTKPSPLSLLVRPYRWRGQSRLGLSVMLLVNARTGAPVLELESKLWEVATDHLDSGGVIDYGIPKVHPEYLVSGHAYTSHQDRKDAVAVAVEVNDKRRELLAIGDRYFIDNNMTDPEPFESMSLGWSSSYGGSNFADNPLGKGAEDRLLGDLLVRPVPNLESPEQRISTKHQHHRPVNFGAQALSWPARFCKIGTYTEKYKKVDFPGFFDDMDPTIFNAAQDEQVWFDRQELADNTRFTVSNMHPEVQHWDGIVPAWRARCLVNLQKDTDSEPVLHDVFLPPKTLWLVPHIQSYLLVFQTSVPCWYEDGHDVGHVLAALEWKYSPKPQDTYLQFMESRENHDESALLAYRDQTLLPENTECDTSVAKDTIKGHLATRLSNFQRYMFNCARENLQSMGLDANRYLPEAVGPMPSPIVDMSLLPEQQKLRDEQIKAMRADFKERMEAKRRYQRTGGKDKTILDLLGGEDYLQEMLSDAENISPSEKESALSEIAKQYEETSPEAEAQAQKRKQSLFAMSAHLVGNQYMLDSTRARMLREQLLQTIEAGQTLEGVDLTGADLSNLVFQDLDFSRSVFKKANLQGTTFVNCCLDESALCGAQLTDTRFESCSMQTFNVNDTHFRDCHLERCQLSKLTPEGMTLTKTVFTNCQISESAIRESRVSDCEFHQVSMQAVVFLKTTISGCAFEDSQISQLAVVDSQVERCRFLAGQLMRTAFTRARMVQNHFENIRLESICIQSQKPVSDCCFIDAHLKNSSMRGLILERVDFDRSIIENCDLSLAVFKEVSFAAAKTPESLFQRAKFQVVDFTGADLSNALMGRSVFEDVNFTHVCFFRTEIAMCEFGANCIEHENYMVLAQREPSERNAS